MLNTNSQKLLSDLVADLVFRGDIPHDVAAFLTYHGHAKTVGHSAQVAAEARRLAVQVGEDEAKAEVAGWLHDVSAVFPAAERIKAAQIFQVEILAEEEIFPMIIHQKLSVVLAHDLFGITDQAILSAVGCHTTLKANAARLDKVLFVADKIAWDQPGRPPYLAELLAGLAKSLDAAALAYIHYLWERRAMLKVVHPWLKEAHQQLSAQV